MELLGPMMMIGMIAGGVSSTVNDSFSNVIDACQAKKNAQEKLDDLNKFWKSNLENFSADDAKLNEFKNGLQNSAVQTGILTVMLKKTFQKKKEAQIIGLSVFTFILILTLLLKYFKVIPNIWNYITKN